MANPDVTAILSSLLSGGTTFQTPAPVQNPNLASILQGLSGQAPPPPPVPQQQSSSIPTGIDLSALLSQFQQQQQPALPPQRWTSPPPSASTRSRWEERPRETERERNTTKKRDVGSRIKASRLDDIRDSVRNSTADQNVYRALCQFYVYPPCDNELTCDRKVTIVNLVRLVLLYIHGIRRCMISRGIPVRRVGRIAYLHGLFSHYYIFPLLFFRVSFCHSVTCFGGSNLRRLWLFCPVFGPRALIQESAP